MRKFVTIFSIVLLFISAVTFPAAGVTTDAQTDPEKRQESLDILKSVLDKLMETEWGSGPGTHIWPNYGTRAVYIAGQGVLFTYQCQTLPLISKNKAAGERAKTAVVNRTENIHQILTDFLGNYGEALEQLKPDDHITVIIQPRENPLRHVIRDMNISMESARFDQIMAAVSKKTVDDYRRKKITKNEFAAKIKFRGTDKNDDQHREIEIMSRIFDTALRNNKKCSMSLQGSTWGEYITDFGILFMLKASNGLKVDKYHFTGDNFQTSGAKSTRRMKKPAEKTAHILQIKTALGELLADYGHTLRHIKPNEWVGVTVELDNFDKRDSSLFLKVKSSVIQNFHHNRISRKAFINKVLFSEY